MTTTKKKRIRVLNLKQYAAHAKILDDITRWKQVNAGTNAEQQIPVPDRLTQAAKAAYAAAHPDHDKLIAALDGINGRASAHTYKANDVAAIAAAAERRLAKDGVTVANRVGTRVAALSDVPTTKAYRRRSMFAIATRVELIRTTTCWEIADIGRVERGTGPGGDEKILTIISPAARDDIVRRALTGYQTGDK